VRTGSARKFDAPRQPESDSSEINRIELVDKEAFRLALSDLEGFDRIWVVSWFDRNRDWRPRVLPPRGPAQRRGVFATRSPHRPNPIGLTSVPLLRIEANVLFLGPLDLLEGTPVLDIKPYLRTVDCHPDSSLGWVAEAEAWEKAASRFRVEVTANAQAELDWLRDHFGINFSERAFRILRIDPTPHRTRRILQIEPGLFRMSCGSWRLFFRVAGDVVCVEQIQKGVSDESLFAPGREALGDWEAQIAFAEWRRTRASSK
jgi:tRNA-Thr(GGU) m(6)t(6)A37 methyltransferase TsaA